LLHIAPTTVRACAKYLVISTADYVETANGEAEDHQGNSRWKLVVQEGDNFFPGAIGIHSVGSRALPPLSRWLYSVKKNVIDCRDVSVTVKSLESDFVDQAGERAIQIWPLKTEPYVANNLRSEQFCG
jgi:hypothetical protein